MTAPDRLRLGKTASAIITPPQVVPIAHVDLVSSSRSAGVATRTAGARPPTGGSDVRGSAEIETVTPQASIVSLSTLPSDAHRKLSREKAVLS